MFGDPQSVTIAGAAKSMPRVSTGDLKSTYSNSDETWRLSISHQKAAKGRIRSLVRFDNKAVVTNPLDSTNDYDTLTVYLVVERPAYGFNAQELKDRLTGYFAWFAASSYAASDKIFGLES